MVLPCLGLKRSGWVKYMRKRTNSQKYLLLLSHHYCTKEKCCHSHFFLINLDFYWYYTDITNKLSKILTFLLTVLDFKKYWKKDWYLKPLNLLILEILRHVLIILIIGHLTYFLIDTFWGLQICPSILNENPWVKDTMWSIWKKYLRGPFSKRLCRSHTSQMTIA